MSEIFYRICPWILGIGFLFAVVCWSLTLIGFFPWWIEDNNRGIFGDSFGGVNALISGLAFAGVIYAIWLQQKELALQREELKNSRKELALQREELAGQRRVMQKETFERTFFRLLEMLDAKRDSMICAGEGRELKGTEVFSRVIWEERGIADKRAGVAVKPYFLLLFKILRFVDQTDFSEDWKKKDCKEKKFYTDIFRDEMKGAELQALLLLATKTDWYAESPNIDGKAFRELIGKYALFFNIRYPVLKNFCKDHKLLFSDFYNRNAFGESSDIDEFYT